MYNLERLLTNVSMVWNFRKVVKIHSVRGSNKEECKSTHSSCCRVGIWHGNFKVCAFCTLEMSGHEIIKTLESGHEDFLFISKNIKAYLTSAPLLISIF